MQLEKKRTERLIFSMKFATISALVIAFAYMFVKPSIAIVPCACLVLTTYLIEHSLKKFTIYISTKFYTVYFFILPFILLAFTIWGTTVQDDIELAIPLSFMLFFIPLMVVLNKFVFQVIPFPLNVEDYGIKADKYYLLLDFINNKAVCHYNDWEINSKLQIKDSKITLYDIRDNRKKYEELIQKDISEFMAGDFQIVEMYNT